jgi:glutamine synthetase
MLETELELAKLGVPIKTRHNEVAPAQYEVAPIFENSNVGTDHQQLCMQIMQTVAKRYGLICLLHEKPFAGVNGSGKHNNWSMSTNLGSNLLEPGDTPHENLQFLFFCTAVLAAVNKHQGLLRASVAHANQDHRLGANEAPPAIISIFLGSELENVFEAISEGTAGVSASGELMGLGTPVLPNFPKHGGDRNRTSPFAFTGNKFEFRTLGSSQSPSLPNAVLNTIVAEAIDDLCEDLEAAMKPKGKGKRGRTVEQVLPQVIGASYTASRPIVFGGDNYAPEWYEEAEQRGLLNLRTTPDALPWLIHEQTITAFSNYGVMNERELHARYEVHLEQYVITVNTEAELAADIAATMLLPASVRYLRELQVAGLDDLAADAGELVKEFGAAIKELQRVNLSHPHDDLMAEACYMRDTVLPAMDEVRTLADRLERVVADDLWPLPKYSEILFIK